mgnify:CR=1 FL=1
MLREIEVAAVRHTLELPVARPGERKAVLDVDRALGVVRELFLRVLEVAEVFWVNPQVHVPIPAGLEPVLVPLLVGAGLDEELHLHLLELARAEDEVAGRDLVAEALADLGDAERRLLPTRLQHVGKVDEHALCGFWSQVGNRRIGLDWAGMGLEHQVEIARLCERVLFAA